MGGLNGHFFPLMIMKCCGLCDGNNWQPVNHHRLCMDILAKQLITLLYVYGLCQSSILAIQLGMVCAVCMAVSLKAPLIMLFIFHCLSWQSDHTYWPQLCLV